MGSDPGWGAKIPHALGPKNQTIKQEQCCNKVNKDFKNCPYQKHVKKKKKEKKNLGFGAEYFTGCLPTTFASYPVGMKLQRKGD